MRIYKVLITHEVLSLPRPSTADRRKLISFLQSLSDDPFQKGDYEDKDDVGRTVQVKIIGRYALTFWADHAVCEVKVIHAEKADRT